MRSVILKSWIHLDKQYAELQFRMESIKRFYLETVFRSAIWQMIIDLKYYAAFAGCSAETMAGFETVTFLAKKADAAAACLLY